MTKEDIIKPENLVAKKPTLMNDNPSITARDAATVWFIN